MEFFFINDVIKEDISFSIDEWLITSNYVSLTLSSLFLFYLYNNLNRMKQIAEFTIIRITKEKVIKEYLKCSTYNCIIYITLLYLLPLMFYYKYLMNFYLLIIYLFCRIVIFYMGEIINIYIYLSDNKYKILCIFPFVLNFIFYFCIVLVILS